MCPQAINTSSEAPLSCREKGARGAAVEEHDFYLLDALPFFFSLPFLHFPAALLFYLSTPVRLCPIFRDRYRTHFKKKLLGSVRCHRSLISCQESRMSFNMRQPARQFALSLPKNNKLDFRLFKDKRSGLEARQQLHLKKSVG